MISHADELYDVIMVMYKTTTFIIFYMKNGVAISIILQICIDEDRRCLTPIIADMLLVWLSIKKMFFFSV